MRTIQYLVLALVALKMCAGFDMWEIIEKNNGKYIEEVKGQRDDTGDRLIRGDVHVKVQEYIANKKAMKREDIKIQNSPRVQNLQPIFDYHRKLWKRRIPYIIKSPLNNAKTKAVIRSSLKKIEDASCLKFIEENRYRSKHNHWIEFYSARGCFSGIGRKYWSKNTPTKISLGQYCDVESIIVHEVLHALGFYHEQSRMDRDSYVKVYMGHVNKAMASNFDKNEPFDSDYAGTPYDVTSIMQYGNTAFRKSVNSGDTMQNKFDPGAKLGGDVLSDLDKLELNRRYQCPHVDLNGKRVPGVMQGWSSWTEFSKCGSNWRGECSKTRYRRCVDSDNCAGGNEYGAQEDVLPCSQTECSLDENAVDGIWGTWGEFSPCDSKCGWGMHIRTRKCNNPAQNRGGKKCEGFGIERKLCRRQRCGGLGSYDTNFESGFGSWTAKNFQRTRGKVYGFSYGPSGDHTLKNERRGGYYAMAKKVEGPRAANPALLTSKSLPAMTSGCLSFHYLLNGRSIHPTLALTVFFREPNGQTRNSAFAKGGHQGKDWQRALVNLGKVVAGTKVVIEAKFQRYKGSVVAIDDIFLDQHACPEDLEGCKDTDPKCSSHAKRGFCSTYWRYMLRKCCKTCQDPKYKIEAKERPCIDTIRWVDKCAGWAKKGECQKNTKWMKNNCCASCKNIKTEPKCVDTTRWKEKCTGWARKGECRKKNQKWMKRNCCASCKNIKPESADLLVEKCLDTTKWKGKCTGWAKKGECKKNEKWMKRNCCASCKNAPVSTEPPCRDNSKYATKCPGWAKKGECAKNPWMKRNCCSSCKKLCVNKHNTARCDSYAANKKAGYCKKNKSIMTNCCLSCYKKHK